MTADHPDNSFKTFIATQAPYEPLLPFVHTTDAWTLHRVLTSELLEPSECPNFKEPLLYLFYGRPSYRPNAKEMPSSMSFMAPVCFVLRPESLRAVVRIFPFDSGAFLSGLFNDFLHPRMTVTEFALEPEPQSPARVVNRFFRSNENYYFSKPTDDIYRAPFAFAVESYSAIIRQQSKASVDDRGSTIEAQTSAPIRLEPGAALAIIFPGCFLDDVSFVAKLALWDVTPITYDIFPRMRPSEFTALIFDRLKDFLRTGKYL